MPLRVPHASRLHTSLKQSGELISDAVVNQRQFADNNALNNNLLSSISNNILINKSVIAGLSTSVSNIQNTINTNQTNINKSLASLTKKRPESDLLKSISDKLFSKTNVLFEEAFNSIDNNIKDTTASVLFAKSLVSTPDNFIIRDDNYMDYSTIREKLDAKYATITKTSSTNVNIWSTDFENNDTITPKYNFVFNNIMYSKFEQPDYNNQDNTIISSWSDTNDSYYRIKKISNDLSNILIN